MAYLQERKKAGEIHVSEWVFRQGVDERESQIYCCKGIRETRPEFCLSDSGLTACEEVDLCDSA